MSETIARIPGAAWQRAAEGDYPNEAPNFWRVLNERATERRYGRSGSQYRVPVTSDIRVALRDLRDYLDAVGGRHVERPGRSAW